ncbi:cob(I)yrinic acid a,c-diamide adenosyltransferase [Propionimicrobium sp. PCR01-08-3]|uniref:cob(I)yrinic acid a,c-diamide adenosyltransferase n=1 Tax=Propionimicrobium sp. PCR01-08-3 TaxID=3052086 RepID=UPI00255C3A3E|nr:cob(I)yrinic acid a,c-diamide adenosyltransferase [Propionimicrobium sp. PCR01-08-3]WIY84031.1 cob(I)yrinic acid a,c-diamide adenosyltransferase [Propionimicrobium sp. PCR01-08-3]
MAQIYTKTGDKGTTGLFGASRVPKQDVAVEAYGTVDEANSSIGEAKVAATDERAKEQLHEIQRRLFVLGAELASDEKGRAMLIDTIGDADISALEHLIDRCNEITGPQTQFIIPGRDLPSATLHRARTVVRRAERRVLTMSETREVRPELIKYLNRCSDTLYALARVAEHQHDLVEIEKIVRESVQRLLNADQPSDAESVSDGCELDHYDLDLLKQMSEAAEAKAREMGLPMVFAGVDAGGNLMLLHRMQGSLLVSLNTAANKAYTAAAFQQPTADLKDLSAETGPIPGIQNFEDGRVVVFGGGLPIFVDGQLAGGIGVSGGSPDEDSSIVKHALSTARKAR